MIRLETWKLGGGFETPIGKYFFVKLIFNFIKFFNFLNQIKISKVSKFPRYNLFLFYNIFLYIFLSNTLNNPSSIWSG